LQGGKKENEKDKETETEKENEKPSTPALSTIFLFIVWW